MTFSFKMKILKNMEKHNLDEAKKLADEIQVSLNTTKDEDFLTESKFNKF